MRNYRIHLIRHGLTEANIQGRYIGTTDLPLCRAGEKALFALAKEDYPVVQKVYSSPLCRCVQTARILFPDAYVQTLPSMTEYHFGAFENKSLDELLQNADFSAWFESGMTDAPPQGEEREVFENRVCAGFHQMLLEIMQEGLTDVALVGHAGVLTLLLAKFGIPQRDPSGWSMEAGKGFSVTTSSQMWGRDRFFEVYQEIPIMREDIDLTTPSYHVFPYDAEEFRKEEILNEEIQKIDD